MRRGLQLLWVLWVLGWGWGLGCCRGDPRGRWWRQALERERERSQWRQWVLVSCLLALGPRLLVAPHPLAASPLH